MTPILKRDLFVGIKSNVLPEPFINGLSNKSRFNPNPIYFTASVVPAADTMFSINRSIFSAKVKGNVQNP